MNEIAEERLDEIRKAMMDKVTVHACPRCNQTNYNVMEGLISISIKTYPEGYSESEMPVIFLTCETCGYTFLHSTVVMGLVSDEELESRSYR